MAKFDAGTAVDAMEYDFTAYGGSAGVVPEPSDDVLDEFYVRLADVMKAAGDLGNLDVKDTSAVAQVLEALDADVIKGISTQISDLIVFLSQGSPTKEDIDLLPFRVKQAFMGWLVGQLAPQA